MTSLELTQTKEAKINDKDNEYFNNTTSLIQQINNNPFVNSNFQ